MIDKKVLVAGCGGLGGYIIEMLLRLGVSEITAADGDVFDESNMNRQIYATRSTIGRKKAEVAAERAAEINPLIKFNAVTQFIDESNADALVKDCSIVIDALDNVESRKLLAAECEKAGIPMVYGAIGDFTAQAAVIYPGDTLLDELYTADAAKQKTVSFVPPFCASMQLALAYSLLNGEHPESGKLYIAGLDDLFFQEIKF